MTIITRAAKGTRLTNDEVDGNFLSLLPLEGGQMQGPLRLAPVDANAVDNQAISAEFLAAKNYLKSGDLFASATQDFAQNVPASTGLAFAYFGSRIRKDNVVTSVPSGSITLLPSTTSFVEVDSSGVVFANTVGFSQGKYPVAIVTTSGASISSVTDQRSFVTIPQTLPVASGTTLGGVKAGSGVSIDEAGVLSVPPGTYTLPVATTLTLGGVKAGTNITIAADGTISAAAGNYTLPAATATSLGGVMAGTNVSIAADGTLSVTFPTEYVLPAATGTTLGGVKVGSGIVLTGDTISVTPSNYTLPVADGTILGGVKIGSGINRAADGTISVPAGTYVLPQADGATLGGIKLGANLTLNATTGQVDAPSPQAYSLPQATADILGGLKLGTGFTFNATTGRVDAAVQSYSLPQASATVLGGLKLGKNLSLNSSTGQVDAAALTYTLPVASGTVLGGVKAGANVTIGTDGSLSVNTTASTSLGNVTFESITMPYTPDVDRGSGGVVSAAATAAYTWVSPKPMAGIVRSVHEETVFASINLNNYIPMDGHAAAGADNALYLTIPDKINEVLAAAGRLGRAARSPIANFGQTVSSHVRVEHHLGDIVARRTIVVPNYTLFHSQGMIFRDTYGSSTNSDWPDQTADSDTVVRGSKNSYIPVLAITAIGHLGSATVVGHNGSVRGTCVITGKEYEGLEWDIPTAGTGYRVGDELELPKHGQARGADETEPKNKTFLRVKEVSSTGQILQVEPKYPTSIKNSAGEHTGWLTYGGDYDHGIAGAINEEHYPLAARADGTTPSQTAKFKVRKYRNDFQDNDEYKKQRDGVAWTEGRYQVHFNRTPFSQTLIDHLNVIEPGDDILESKWGFHYGFCCSTKNIEINRLYVIGGRISICFRDASDARVNQMNTVLAGVGLRVAGYTSWSCPNAIFDSSWGTGVELSGCSGTQINGRIFWENSNDGRVGQRRGHKPHQFGYALRIGHTGSTNQITSAVDARFQITNAGNLDGTGVGCQIDRLSMSKVEVIYTNSEYNGIPDTRTKKVRTLFQFGSQGTGGGTLQKQSDGVTPIMRNDSVIVGQISHLGATQYAYEGDPQANYLHIWDGGRKAVIRNRGVAEIHGDGNPVDGTSGTGVGYAVGASTYIRSSETAGASNIWVNTGTKASPVWKPMANL